MKCLLPAKGRHWALRNVRKSNGRFRSKEQMRRARSRDCECSVDKVNNWQFKIRFENWQPANQTNCSVENCRQSKDYERKESSSIGRVINKRETTVGKGI